MADKLDGTQRDSLWPVARLLLLVTAFIVAGVLVWKLSGLLLLAFGAILVAVLLKAFADLIASHTPIHGRWSLLAAGTIILVAVVGFVAVVGTQLQQQLLDLINRLPDLVDRLQDRLGIVDIEDWLTQHAERAISAGGILSSIAGYSSWLVGGVANVLLVFAAGLYLAVNPGLYRTGVLQLFPPHAKEEAADTLDTLAGALKLWLVGQIASMLLVGTLTTIGLWLLGIQSALALGFIAGLLEFVPFIGPVLSGVPAVALALASDPLSAIWVIGLYVLVQQTEGNLITPLVQQRTVHLPPALTIFSIVGFGILFGPLGILFATPLTVVCFVLVKKLWVQDALGDDTEIPGDPHKHHGGAEPPVGIPE